MYRSPDKAEKPILTPDFAVPSEGVSAEGNTGQIGEEVPAILLPFRMLNQDSHSLVVVNQAVFLPVQNGVRVQRTGKDALDGIQELFQIFLRRALIGAEIAVVFTGERVPEVIFQKTG
ncbi:MAG: hypothetical protein R3C44_12175 [Chloroflexota bacterium]